MSTLMPHGVITVQVNGQEVAGVVEIQRSMMPGDTETLWRGDPNGIARLVSELANVRAENRELRIMMQRARRALEIKSNS